MKTLLASEQLQQHKVWSNSNPNFIVSFLEDYDE